MDKSLVKLERVEENIDVMTVVIRQMYVRLQNLQGPVMR